MIGRWLRRVLRLVVASVVVLALAGGLLAWRLRRAPISLDAFVPRLETAFSDDVAVRIGAAELAWNQARHRPELRARDVRLGSPGDGSTLALAAVALRLQMRALVHAQLVVTAIELLEPQLDLIRAGDGRIAFGTRSPGAEPSASAGPDVDRVRTMLARLRSVSLRGGDLTLVDEPTGTRLRLPRVDGSLWRDGARLRLQLELEIACEPARVPVSVEGTFDEETRRFEAQMTGGAIATDAGLGCWPAELASEARRWVVANITGGTVRDPRLLLAGHADEGLDALAATLGFEGLQVRFVDTMMPATVVDGTAAFSLDGAEFEVTRAAVAALEVKPASVRLAWKEEGPPRIAIDGRVEGPLSSALEVLDAEPIALAGTLGILTRGVTGRVEGRVTLAFPLGEKHTVATLGLGVNATVRGAAIPQMPGGWAMTAADLDVKVDGRGVTVEGRARLRDQPVEIHALERFGDPSARRIELAARLERAERAALGLDLGDAVEGPVDAIVRLGRGAEGGDAADVEVDLRDATLALPMLALRKPAGEAGRAIARLSLARGVVTAVERAELAVGGTSMRAIASRPPAGGPWSKIDVEVTLAPPSPEAAPGEAVLALRADGDTWRATLTSPNAGNLVAVFGNAHIRRGKLSFEGTVDPFAEGFPFEGRLVVEDVTAVGLPWLVRVISLTSVEGLMGMTSEKTIPFDRVTASLRHHTPKLVLTDAQARGPKLGLVFESTIDFATDALDLNGTLIPSYYWLNEAPGRIPLIGGMLERATGGAIQAVNFTVRGTRTDPEVSVKPLSSIAPGALRDLLQKLGL